MTRILEAEPLTAAAFAPFGDVIQVDNAEGLVINEGYATASTIWPVWT